MITHLQAVRGHDTYGAQGHAAQLQGVHQLHNQIGLCRVAQRLAGLPLKCARARGVQEEDAVLGCQHLEHVNMVSHQAGCCKDRQQALCSCTDGLAQTMAESTRAHPLQPRGHGSELRVSDLKRQHGARHLHGRTAQLAIVHEVIR